MCGVCQACAGHRIFKYIHVRRQKSSINDHQFYCFDHSSNFLSQPKQYQLQLKWWYVVYSTNTRSRMRTAFLAALVSIAVLPAIQCGICDGNSTVVYYGFELPKPFCNYWNYTTDVQEMDVSAYMHECANSCSLRSKPDSPPSRMRL